jgi:preprotein translocase subunit SecD
VRAGLVVVAIAVLVATGTGTAAAGETHTFEFRPVIAQLPETAPKSRQTAAEAGAVASCDEARLATVNNVGPTPRGKQRPNACAIVTADMGVPAVDRLLLGPARIDGDGVQDVEQRFQNEQHVVLLTLTRPALKKFNQLAKESYGRQPPRNEVAMVVDGVAVSAPAFQEPRFDGTVQISGAFTRESAARLVAKIKSACDC